jgi:hypothetical protein
MSSKPTQATGAEAARWITRDADMVARIIDEVLEGEAWWVAATTGAFAQRGVVWVDDTPTEGARRPSTERIRGRQQVVRAGPR